MNIKLIFVFTICVVLPNALCFMNIRDIEAYRQSLVQQWTPSYQKNSTFTDDADGNIFIKLLLQHSANKTELFMDPDMKRVGIYVTTKTYVELKANLQVMKYFGFLLVVPFYDISINDDSDSKPELKTLKIDRGNSDLVDVMKTIVDKYVELKYLFKEK